MSQHFRLLSGTGNRFALVDTLRDGAPRDPERLARELCAPGALDPRPDGLLLLVPALRGGDVRMELVNADGSRPQTCGNGLRCVAKVAVEHGHVRAPRLTIEDDAGLHTAEVDLDGKTVVRAAVGMGRPRIVTRDERIQLSGGELGHDAAQRVVLGARVDVGNPHFVLVRDAVSDADVRALGPQLERHAAFPEGTNVEFAWRGADGWMLRVWERGVGETEACGSGACATAAVLAESHGAALPLSLILPGGVLAIAADARGEFVLAGDVEDLGWHAWPQASRVART